MDWLAKRLKMIGRDIAESSQLFSSTIYLKETGRTTLTFRHPDSDPQLILFPTEETPHPLVGEFSIVTKPGQASRFPERPVPDPWGAKPQFHGPPPPRATVFTQVPR